MPGGPEGQKRPGDAARCADKAFKIAAGRIDGTTADDRQRNKAKGGHFAGRRATPSLIRVKSALWEAFSTRRPDILDNKGYARDFHDLLPSMVLPEDFADDLRAGNGSELYHKFRAAHSSSALS
ncbi:MAG: hypothetical protein OXC66_13485 [Roseovarius sp.]|nr:hypothetical protein [Roseovarius sp.]